MPVTGRRRKDLEHSGRLLRSRIVYAAEGCAGRAAEQDGSFFAILDQGTLAEISAVEGDEVPGGSAVYEFDTAAMRDAFLDDRCRGMKRLD